MDWPYYQLTVEGARAYQNLYDNYNGIRDSWAEYWAKLAQEFSSYENLLGYDLMNEPFAGDIYRNPFLLLPGVADRVNLQTFFEEGARAIRKYDDKTIIMIAGITWDNFNYGFTNVPGGKDYSNRTAISYHYYPAGPNLFSSGFHFRQRLADAKKLKCGLFMSEFDGPNTIGRTWDVIEVADKYKQRYIIDI